MVGPLVEIGTVFRPRWAWAVTCWAVLATAVLAVGWCRACGSSRRRLAGLVPVATLPLLLVWPFTEAGRFLVPLVPMILVGAVEGLAIMRSRWRPGRSRRWAAGLVLAASVPYTVYAAATDRAGVQRRLQEPFDAACSWIVKDATRPGPVLTMHPAEVFWQTGRPALAPDRDDDPAIAAQIRRYGVAYLIVDEDRYAREPSSPLGRFVIRHPDRVHCVEDRDRRVTVYETLREGRPGGWGVADSAPATHHP